MPRDLPNFSHGDRVRIGFDGPRGVVLKCKAKPPKTGHYWKVKLDDGRWVWPAGAVADSEGLFEGICVQCRIPFRSGRAFEVMCNNCDVAGVGAPTSAPGDQIRNPAAYAAETRRARAAERAPAPLPDEDAERRF